MENHDQEHHGQPDEPWGLWDDDLELHHPQPQAAQPQAAQPRQGWRQLCDGAGYEHGDELIAARPDAGVILADNGDRNVTWTTTGLNEPFDIGIDDLAALMQNRNRLLLMADDLRQDLLACRGRLEAARAELEKYSRAVAPTVQRLTTEVGRCEDEARAAQEALEEVLVFQLEPVQALVERAQRLLIRMLDHDVPARSIFAFNQLIPDPGPAGSLARLRNLCMDYARAVALRAARSGFRLTIFVCLYFLACEGISFMVLGEPLGHFAQMVEPFAVVALFLAILGDFLVNRLPIDLVRHPQP